MNKVWFFLGKPVREVRLLWRLFRDQRVHWLLKLIPVLGVLYLFSPIDLIPDLKIPGLGILDDLLVLVLGFWLFSILAPPAIVKEHLEDMSAIKVKYRVDKGNGTTRG